MELFVRFVIIDDFDRHSNFLSSIRNLLLLSIVACKTEINKIREKNQIHLNLNLNINFKT